MGKYDDLLVGTSPKTGGKYDDLLSDVKPSNRSGTVVKALEYLPTVGAVTGGLLASPLPTPIRAGAAGLGGGAGEAFRQLGRRFTGQTVPQTSTEAATDIAKVAGVAGATEAVTPAIMKVGGRAIGFAKPALKTVGNFGARVGEVLTNVPARQFVRLAKDPSALVTAPPMFAAKPLYAKRLKNLGIDTTPSPEELFDPQLTRAKAIGRSFFTKLKEGVKKIVQAKEVVKEQLPLVDSSGKPIIKNIERLVSKEVKVPFKPNAQEIIKARQAVDRTISGTSYKDKETLTNLYKNRVLLNEMLENVSGPAREASQKYARSAMASQFRKVLPETQTGKLSFVRSVLTPLAFRALGPQLALTSPMVAGGITALGAGTVKGLSKPLSQRAILQSIAQSLARRDR